LLEWAGFVPVTGPLCKCGHPAALHHDRRVTGALYSPCGPGGPEGCTCLDYHAAGTPPRPALAPLLQGRADLAHAITSAIRRGALITIGPFGGGDDAAIRVSIDYRNTTITATMVDPFEALALALAQWVRVHG
jgi:hypothetical protein